MQLLQSLWHDNTMRNSGAWKVQFPLAISSSLHRFSVLRSVVSLSQVKGDSAVDVRSIKLPLGSDSQSESYWDSTQYVVNHKDRIACAVPYTYWVKFSTDGSRIFFIDPKTVAAYSIKEGKSLEVHLESSTKTPRKTENNLLRTTDALFHPLKPLLSFRMARWVYLWQFNERKKYSIGRL